MYASIAEIILENEKNDYRFESFSREICEKHEGISFLPTSQSWDRGRDARSSNPGKGSHRNIVCCTLNIDINQKVDSDLLRVTATSSPDRLVYCSSQKLSEMRVDEITKIIRRHIPKGSVLVLGSIQLAVLAEKYSEVFEKYYQAELQLIRNTIIEKPPSEDKATYGLRLALIAFGSDEAVQLRHDLLNTLVLSFFGDKNVHTVAQIVQELSKDLGLPRPLRTDLVEKTVQQAEQDGVLRREGNGFLITAYGQQQLDTFPKNVAVQLLKGRELVRTQLEILIGKKLNDKQFNMLWSGLVDFLAGLFHANGLNVIRAVERFISAKTDSNEEDEDLRTLLSDGVRKVVSIIATPDLRNVVERAILDIFTEHSSEAFEWLTRIAERFVMLCSLGLEASSADQVRRVLTAHQVVLDSDIIIDYLCAGESQHKRAQEMLSRWLQIGGRLLVSPVVLEEVAHHAWISDNDFRETEYLLGKLKKYELKRFIKSAFVRTYHTLDTKPGKWPLYISQFKGNAPGDYSKIQGILRQRLKVETLPASYDVRLSESITEYLLKSIDREPKWTDRLEDMTYKVERDGKLMASISAARIAEQKMGEAKPIVLLSSSGRLRRVENFFGEHFGEAKVIVSLGAFAYLLAATPDVGLGADSLRQALFDFGASAGLNDVERRALRIIRASEEYDIPWAERGLLQQNLTANLRSEAEKRGISPDSLRTRLEAGKDPKTSARLIVESLKDLAVDSKTSKNLAASQQKVSQLEAKIFALEESLATTGTQLNPPPRPHRKY
ncbi:MAG TPA: hypothetical protein VFR24_02135 [Candidatus Angelobacter sp.]|nr:hypothetical protein [Candidatus Angelobacter sp.]